MNIFLDDVRNPADVTWDRDMPRDVEWLIVRSIYEFIDAILAYGSLIKHIAFDHDLADQHYEGVDDEMTGYAAAKWLVAFCAQTGVKLPAFSCHSMNAAGRANILGYLTNAKEHL